MSFTNLVVRKWDGDEWPEKRISLGCRYEGQSVAISPRYTELSVAEQDFEEIAVRVNNHERLVQVIDEALTDIHVCGNVTTETEDKMRELLDQLQAGKGGEW